MSHPGKNASDAELSAYYEQHHSGPEATPDETSSEEWAEPQPADRPPLLDVTISVRFTSEEITAIRARAAEAGLKPTTYIRRCALAGAGQRIDPVRFAHGLEALSRDLDNLRRAAS